jgi:hypothetical protein
MNALERSWRHRRVVNSLPTCLRRIRITGPVRFDSTLQTAGEIRQTCQAYRPEHLKVAVERAGRLVPPELALDNHLHQQAV